LPVFVPEMRLLDLVAFFLAVSKYVLSKSWAKMLSEGGGGQKEGGKEGEERGEGRRGKRGERRREGTGREGEEEEERKRGESGGGRREERNVSILCIWWFPEQSRKWSLPGSQRRVLAAHLCSFPGSS
jgi:hypothetical protein